MEREEAREILSMLAKGISPVTGEILATESPFNEPKVIRALIVALEQFPAASRAAASERKLPAQAGKSWPPEEDKRLLEAFDAGVKPNALAEIHGRTRGAIDSRLTKLGRLTSGKALPVAAK
ncbi:MULTISPECIES: hypothetical protein [Paraburkholderia]|uniref:Uncharacterized protein n=1 Tax=Paraburkholderia madseniana TaxID=2599607 RepID=A0AAP5EU37_9BURK|nr:MULTISPECIES: hypothetical protein [Paraburkholderia]MCX4151973.1 hypothetical protein [Paraburkholderia madseniana]MCX4175608.1 hypothetical protein [Paraburkholderia madseniana]MDN7154901.1 hypothetical protein [Paraburkholderia sp. WS6]MDQ6413784.1 hypothetical protein [Paraburkholderia madseniana]MDQ6463604.1 hypothetical protein [Paraburkholderia madseniana]